MREKSKSLAYKTTLFASYKEWGAFLLAIVIIGAFSIFLEYRNFLTLKADSRIQAQVLLQYIKSDERGERTVLKLKSDKGALFYTTSRESLANLRFRYVLLKANTKKLTFSEYIRGFYLHAFEIVLLKERDRRDKIRDFINAQHQSPLAGSFYRTLFLADPLEKSLRDGAARLGISHLLAISGFHLGVLWAILFGAFYLLYRPLHRRYFPYRNMHYDLGGAVLCVIFGYLLLLADSPSFLRAFAMALWGYFLLYRGIAIFSFSSLAFIAILLIALFPRLLFSVGFFLSVSGVFLILLHLLHTHSWNKIANFFALNFALYFYMLIPVHFFFDLFSLEQLFSPLLTMLFTLFYPLVLLLHLLGLGYVGDSHILSALGGEYRAILVHASYQWGIPYLFLALLAIRYSYAYWLLGVVSLSFFFNAVYRFFLMFG